MILIPSKPKEKERINKYIWARIKIFSLTIRALASGSGPTTTSESKMRRINRMSLSTRPQQTIILSLNGSNHSEWNRKTRLPCFWGNSLCATFSQTACNKGLSHLISCRSWSVKLVESPLNLKVWVQRSTEAKKLRSLELLSWFIDIFRWIYLLGF